MSFSSDGLLLCLGWLAWDQEFGILSGGNISICLPMASIILSISSSEGGPSGPGGFSGSSIRFPISWMTSSITAGLWTTMNLLGSAPTFLKLCQAIEGMETVSPAATLKVPNDPSASSVLTSNSPSWNRKVSVYSCRCSVGGPPPAATVTSRTRRSPEVCRPEALIVVTSAPKSQCSPPPARVTFTVFVVSMNAPLLCSCARGVGPSRISLGLTPFSAWGRSGLSWPTGERRARFGPARTTIRIRVGKPVSEYLRHGGEGREDGALHEQRRSGEVHEVAVVAQNKRHPQQVGQAGLRADLPVLGQAEEGLEELLGLQRRPEPDYRHALLLARVPPGVGRAHRYGRPLAGCSITSPLFAIALSSASW